MQHRSTFQEHSHAALLLSREAEFRRMGIRRARQQASVATVSTGWGRLDSHLPGGGYPLRAITEILAPSTGMGELTLLLPCLKARLNADPERQLVLLAPPHRLDGSALDAAGLDRARMPVIACQSDQAGVWCIEQLAGAGRLAAVLFWSHTLTPDAIRRLQLMAEKAHCPVFIQRPLAQASQRSPAALRLTLQSMGGRQRLEILKCRGPAGKRLAGLHVGQDTPWSFPAARPDIGPASHACNEVIDHDLARTPLPPLGTR